MADVPITDLSTDELRSVIERASAAYVKCLAGAAKDFNDGELHALRTICLAIAAREPVRSK